MIVKSSEAPQLESGSSDGMDTCVIVSYYDERPAAELISLLRQLNGHKSRKYFEIKVIVNSIKNEDFILPIDLSEICLEVRKNTGFNIGAWDHGWRRYPGFRFYIFLQDECEVFRQDWLDRYRYLLSAKSSGLVGESKLEWRRWKEFSLLWPEVTSSCLALGARHNIKLGRTPTHLQSLVLGATRECLLAMNGFITADDKVDAIATEVLLSRHCVSLGYTIRQSAWLPFQYFCHPQWHFLREISSTFRWTVSKIFKRIYYWFTMLDRPNRHQR